LKCKQNSCIFPPQSVPITEEGTNPFQASRQIVEN